jgi:hypothetical protein
MQKRKKLKNMLAKLFAQRGSSETTAKKSFVARGKINSDGVS